MAQLYDQVRYSASPGRKPSVVLMFMPQPDDVPHTQADLDAAHVALDQCLREAWGVPRVTLFPRRGRRVEAEPAVPLDQEPSDAPARSDSSL